MSNENEGGLFSCPVMCWIIGALLALATYLILSGRYELSTFLSLVAALGVFVLSGALLGRLFCRAPISTHGHTARHDHDIAASRQSVVSADSSGAMVSGIPDEVSKVTSVGAAAAAAGAATKTASASKAKSSKSASKSASKPAAKPKAKAPAKPKAKAPAKPKAKAPAKPKAKSASAASTGTKKAAAKPAAKPKAKAAAKPAVKKAAAKPAAKPKAKAAAKPAAKKPAAKTAAKPTRKPVAKDGKPEMLKKARASGADDLKQIKGVGPKMETMLNKMGFYHFDQVSGWRAKEVQWVDNNLEGFKGRVSRDEWVKQAKILARGGKTEFSKKVAKGGVYTENKK